MTEQVAFRGNPEHLKRFLELVESPIHSEERGEALDTWRAYNRMATAPDGSDPRFKSAKWQDYFKPRILDLRGVAVPFAFLGKADLQGARLDDADFSGARLKNALFDYGQLDKVDLKDSLLLGASFEEASLVKADLRGADAGNASFRGANLSGANLSGCRLNSVDFSGANLSEADLSGAYLSKASLVEAEVSGAVFDDSCVYGISAWDLLGDPASAQRLAITREQPLITVDNLKVAQFVYLMYCNPEIREVLDTVTRKVVLILGRFSEERKQVLDALRVALRKYDYVPVIFDFDAPANRDLTETVTLLARMARFVVADLTDPASIPQELQAIAPDVAVPIKLIIKATEQPYAMSADLRKYPWVLKPFRYHSLEHLLESLPKKVVKPAEKCRRKLGR